MSLTANNMAEPAPACRYRRRPADRPWQARHITCIGIGALDRAGGRLRVRPVRPLPQPDYQRAGARDACPGVPSLRVPSPKLAENDGRCPAAGTPEPARFARGEED